MGYTHHWDRAAKLTRTEFRLALRDIKRIRIALRPRIRFEYDIAKPAVFNDKLIRFNGIELEEGHETFYIERVYTPMEWENPDEPMPYAFCKTARKPYDTFVCCCLIILNYYFGDEFKVGSAGDLCDWQQAIDRCDSVLGYGKSFKFSR
tara:strand:+ start:28151 stop:28597 length:447 start_codon:yes stop_codon:yes gene_type:complete